MRDQVGNGHPAEATDIDGTLKSLHAVECNYRDNAGCRSCIRLNMGPNARSRGAKPRNEDAGIRREAEQPPRERVEARNRAGVARK